MYSFFKKFYFYLEDNFSTVSYWFLPYNNMNQPSTYIYPLPPEPPPQHPCPTLPRSSQSTKLNSLCYIATSSQLFISQMVMYKFQCYSQFTPPSLFPSVSNPFSTSVSLLLPCKQVHQYHFSRWVLNFFSFNF